jgi:phosphatidylglycerophosphatase A
MSTSKSQIEALPAVAQPAPRWATLVATFFGAGRLKPGPGTWGSLSAALLWWLIASRIPQGSRLAVICCLIAVAVAVGIPAATLEARGCGRRDPSHVVIDEVAGQLFTLIAVPIGWKPLLAGFILFRVFDILKPWPIRRLERLPEGTGIVVDDLGAGVYGLIVMQLLLHFGLLGLP